MKRSIIDALNPVEVAEDEEVAALGNRGVWVNKAEVKNWRGPIPITDYKLNDDALPDMITKTIHQPVEYTQDISVKYLKPPTPPAHGDLVIRQENDVVRPVAPPQIIRQLAPRPRTPEPLVIREKPPQKPSVLPREVITLPGTVYDPPAREVIVERMATLPPKPQPIVIEKWLPYERQKRRVVYEPPTFVAGPPEKPKNTFIQWQVPNSIIKKQVRYLGVEKADPNEYASKHNGSLKDIVELPVFGVESSAMSEEFKNAIKEIKKRENDSDLLFTRNYLDLGSGHKLLLGATQLPVDFYELEGDIEALKLIDLNKQGFTTRTTTTTTKTTY